MASIGFRCWGDAVAFVVLDGTVAMPTLVANGKRKAPSHSSRPEALRWLRAEIHEILDAYPCSSGFLKIIEPNAREKNRSRPEFEGVLQEAALAHSSALSVSTRIKTQIKHDIAFPKAARYLGDLGSLPSLSSLPADQQDALHAAMCGLPQS